MWQLTAYLSEQRYLIMFMIIHMIIQMIIKYISIFYTSYDDLLILSCHDQAYCRFCSSDMIIFIFFRSKNENRSVAKWLGWGSRFRFAIIWFNDRWGEWKSKNWKGNQSFSRIFHDFSRLKILIRKKDSRMKSTQTVSTMILNFSVIQKKEKSG